MGWDWERDPSRVVPRLADGDRSTETVFKAR